MKFLKYILFALFTIVLALILFVSIKFGTNRNNPYDNENELVENEIPVFKEVVLNFEQQNNSEKSLPVIASALIDVNNDGVDEVFFGGGFDQQDELFAYNEKTFVSISKNVNIPQKNNLTTLAAASADFDNNGFSDLILSREDGITIYYNTDGVFVAQKIDYPLASNATPLGFALGDIDRDGDIDIFVSNYIRKNQMEGQNNFTEGYGPISQLLINNGDNTFTDKTDESGLIYNHNTFMGIFVDMDNDGWLDLIVAHDTGEVRTYKNKTDGSFEMKPNPTTNKFGYPMGIAVGDYNNDGKVDFMFSNTGSTVPHFMASGNIENKTLFNSDWIFFKNKGNFDFEDVAKEVKVSDFEFSWGAVMADMNNDGLQELIVAENYVEFPPHKVFKLPGRFLTQNKNHEYVATEGRSGVVNKNFGITPLVSDFNQDGYQDLIWVNIAGPAKAYINNGGDNNYIQLVFAENSENIGAKVEVVTTSGKTITEDYIIGEGLVSDQSATVHIGLGKDEVDSVKIIYADGTIQILDDVILNTRRAVAKEKIETLEIKNED
ncbi:CRTAC1 family protein [Cellulophaga baltica]|uniref:CRTAC1 family protein n=1 Tax=Cellulophaga TaxID=104264 RepID=UPI001C0679B9|nr:MULTISPECIES: CRTAC1 family protein [Cellulophaga]MBU2996079.1 CRTAC1 family protein [Cellulophaga baltica]MDO6767474.1 CRTAC1 family protein [Cellulophaga sp. 1_MG-2023]